MRSPIPAAWLIVALVLTAALSHAQTFTVLHNFTNSPDGAQPFSSLLPSGNTLYGVAHQGGTNGSGIVFSVNTDGTGYTILHDFSSDTNGGSPEGGLVQSGDTLYGTTALGGTNGPFGTIFSIKTNGSLYTVMHSFDTNNGAQHPHSRLILAGGTLYGTAIGAAGPGWGAVFSLNTDGTGYNVLHTFSIPHGSPVLTNYDGEQTQGGVVLWNDTLYGTAFGGGTNGFGTVYSVTTNGDTFNVLHTFANTPDGSRPQEGLAVLNGTLYGTTETGGTNGRGTVFSLDTGGGNYQVLHSFLTNDVDGNTPWGALTASGGTLYGTTRDGSISNIVGTVFSINADGSGYAVLGNFTGNQSFAVNTIGMHPIKDLLVFGNIIYGTASMGGPSGVGTVFALAVTPGIIGIALSGTDVALAATNGVGGARYSVMASPDLSRPLSQWTPLTTNVLATGGNFTLTATNAVDPAAPQQFYLLQAR